MKSDAGFFLNKKRWEEKEMAKYSQQESFAEELRSHLEGQMESQELWVRSELGALAREMDALRHQYDRLESNFSGRLDVLDKGLRQLREDLERVRQLLGDQKEWMEQALRMQELAIKQGLKEEGKADRRWFLGVALSILALICPILVKLFWS